MKKVIVIAVLACASLLSCNSSSSSENTPDETASNAEVNEGRLDFTETSFDFGDIKEGDVVSHAFKFKNVGSDPVEISAVNVSCGCTVASKPTKPVGVGMEDEIVINFNSSGKVGVNNKTVGVFSNAQNNSITLKFTANVAAKE